MRPADAVTVSVFVAADPATAFEVFTEEVDLWWRRGPKYRAGGKRASRMVFEPGVGGRLIEHFETPPGGRHEFGRVLAWEPGVRLAFEFRGPNFQDDQKTRVEVSFEPQRDGTRVQVEHSGWDTLPADHPVRHGLDARRFAAMWGGMWSDQLRSVRARVASPDRGAPSP